MEWSLKALCAKRSNTIVENVPWGFGAHRFLKVSNRAISDGIDNLDFQYSIPSNEQTLAMEQMTYMISHIVVEEVQWGFEHYGQIS